MPHPPRTRKLIDFTKRRSISPQEEQFSTEKVNSSHLNIQRKVSHDRTKAFADKNRIMEDGKGTLARKPSILIPSFKSLQESEAKAMSSLIFATSNRSSGTEKDEEKVDFMFKVSPISSRQRKLSHDGSTSSVESVRSHIERIPCQRRLQRSPPSRRRLIRSPSCSGVFARLDSSERPRSQSPKPQTKARIVQRVCSTPVLDSLKNAALEVEIEISRLERLRGSSRKDRQGMNVPEFING